MAIIFLIVLALLIIIGAIYCSSNNVPASETTQLLSSNKHSRTRVILKNTSELVKKQTQKIVKVIIKQKPPMLIMKCPSCYREFKVPSTSIRFHCPYCNRTIEFEESGPNPEPKYL